MESSQQRHSIWKSQKFAICLRRGWLPRWALLITPEAIRTILLEVFLIAEICWGYKSKRCSICAVISHLGPGQTSLINSHSLLSWIWDRTQTLERVLTPGSHRWWIGTSAPIIQTSSQTWVKNQLRSAMWATSDPPLAFVNKVLLERSQAHSFTYYLWLFFPL